MPRDAETASSALPRLRSPRVLMVIDAAYPAPRGGGSEAQVRTLARGLRARGVKVTVLAPMLAHGPQRRVERLDGVPVVRLKYPRLRLLGGPLLWGTLAAFLYRRRNLYGAWHVHIAHHMGAVCALMGQLLDRRVLVKVSGWWELEKGTLAPGAAPLTRLAHRLLLKADGWQAISQRIAQDLRRSGIPSERILRIPNAVDTRRFAYIAHPAHQAPVFIFIGRVVAEKGLPTLFDAFARIVPEFPAAKLLIVGDGVMLPELRERAASMGISSNIEFAGHQDDIERQLARADVGVLTSRIEGLSNTLLECMASGLPMIASRISGNEDFVEPGVNGWLYEAGAIDALANCLREAAAATPAQRAGMGANARAKVQRDAGLDQVLERLTSVYRGDAGKVAIAAIPGRSA